MTRDDLRIFCIALGFLAAIQSELSEDKIALRAKSIGRLAESFCYMTVPDCLGATNQNLGNNSDPDTLDRIIDRYIAELASEESAVLPDDRQSLLVIFQRLLVRQLHRQQRRFYEIANEEMIADRILNLAEEEIERVETES